MIFTISLITSEKISADGAFCLSFYRRFAAMANHRSEQQCELDYENLDRNPNDRREKKREREREYSGKISIRVKCAAASICFIVKVKAHEYSCGCRYRKELCSRHSWNTCVCYIHVKSRDKERERKRDKDMDFVISRIRGGVFYWWRHINIESISNVPRYVWKLWIVTRTCRNEIPTNFRIIGFLFNSYIFFHCFLYTQVSHSIIGNQLLHLFLLYCTIRITISEIIKDYLIAKKKIARKIFLRWGCNNRAVIIITNVNWQRPKTVSMRCTMRLLLSRARERN